MRTTHCKLALFLLCSTAVGCAESPQDDAEIAVLGESLRVSGSTCFVEPNPVGVNETYTVQASGLLPDETYLVRVRDPDGGDRQSFFVDASGQLSLEGSSAVAGNGSVSIYRARRRSHRTSLRRVARCHFEVVDATSECTPRTCESQDASCGSVDDGCGGILTCGECDGFDTCGGGGTDNQCGCTPVGCADVGATCGTIDDGCGGMTSCGSCEAPDTCGGGGQANVCGSGTCTPITCRDVGASCGVIDDGCHGLLDCGTCSDGGVCGAVTPNVCEAPPSSDSWPQEWSAFEVEVLSLVNQERARGATCGTSSFAPTGPLTMEPALRQAARLHSEDMATQNYFSHTSLDGRSFLDRMNQSGWDGACPCGENIAAGQRTPAEVVAAWMNSPGHCANIMRPTFGAIGIGYAADSGSNFRGYWTQDFAAN